MWPLVLADEVTRRSLQESRNPSDEYIIDNSHQQLRGGPLRAALSLNLASIAIRKSRISHLTVANGPLLRNNSRKFCHSTLMPCCCGTLAGQGAISEGTTLDLPMKMENSVLRPSTSTKRSHAAGHRVHAKSYKHSKSSFSETPGWAASY